MSKDEARRDTCASMTLSCHVEVDKTPLTSKLPRVRAPMREALNGLDHDSSNLHTRGAQKGVQNRSQTHQYLVTQRHFKIS